jgi:hypothetical protein
MSRKNLELLSAAKTAMNRWNNDNGFDNDDAFENDGGEDFNDDGDTWNDGGYEEAAGSAITKRHEKARPYIIIVQNASGGAATINLLNSSVNRTSANFGNVAGVNITYGYPNQTYGGFLQTTENQPFNMGVVRVEGANVVDLPNAVTFTETQYQGDANTSSVVLDQALNQYLTYLKVKEVDVLVNATKLMQYVQLDATTLTWKLYPAEVLSASRPLEKKNMVKILDNPNNTVLPQKTVVIQRGGKTSPRRYGIK